MTDNVHVNAEKFEDQTLKCIGLPEKPCGNDFVWDANDQAFYEEKGFSKPKRCKNCARERRAMFGPK